MDCGAADVGVVGDDDGRADGAAEDGCAVRDQEVMVQAMAAAAAVVGLGVEGCAHASASAADVAGAGEVLTGGWAHGRYSCDIPHRKIDRAINQLMLH